MNTKKKLGMITLDVVDRTLVGSGAKTEWPEFPYQVLFQKADGVTFKRLGEQDRDLLPYMLEAGEKLLDAGADALADHRDQAQTDGRSGNDFHRREVVGDGVSRDRSSAEHRD